MLAFVYEAAAAALRQRQIFLSKNCDNIIENVNQFMVWRGYSFMIESNEKLKCATRTANIHKRID